MPGATRLRLRDAQAQAFSLHSTEPRINLRDAPFDQIYIADEIRDPARARSLINLNRRAALRDLAAVHHGDAVGKRHRLVLIVRDDHEGGGEFLL